MDVSLHESISSTYSEVYACHIKFLAADGDVGVLVSFGDDSGSYGDRLQEIKMPL